MCGYESVIFCQVNTIICDAPSLKIFRIALTVEWLVTASDKEQSAKVFKEISPTYQSRVLNIVSLLVEFEMPYFSHEIRV